VINPTKIASIFFDICEDWIHCPPLIVPEVERIDGVENGFPSLEKALEIWV